MKKTPDVYIDVGPKYYCCKSTTNYTMSYWNDFKYMVIYYNNLENKHKLQRVYIYFSKVSWVDKLLSLFLVYVCWGSLYKFGNQIC